MQGRLLQPEVGIPFVLLIRVCSTLVLAENLVNRRHVRVKGTPEKELAVELGDCSRFELSDVCRRGT